MATSTPTLISIDEYLRTSYHPDCDYVDGEIQERNLGEFSHGAIQMEIGFWFRARRDEWQIWVVPEQRTRVSETRVRIPDICIFPLASAHEPVRVTPALAAIEILSLEDRLAHVIRRLDDFAAMGPKHIWIIDPERRLAYTYSQGELSPPIFDRLTMEGSPIYLDLLKIFSILDGPTA